MKKSKLQMAIPIDEVNATVCRANKPLTRKVYLMARRWYELHVNELAQLGYKGKIAKFPKHKLGKLVEKVQAMPLGRMIEIFTF